MFTDPLFRRHETGVHPECPARIEVIESALRGEGALAGRIDWQAAEPATDEAILRCHERRYLEELRRIDGKEGALDPDTVYSPATWQAARLAAGCVVRAAEECFRGTWSSAFCLIRPPGHHATAGRAMGFCFLNNVAIAARHLQSLGCEKLLIIDWDVHHGNGTQEIFFEDPTVFYYSLHLHPHYPGTGLSHETGRGAGDGTTLNRPLSRGFAAARFRDLFESDLDSIISRFSPDFALISCGFDSHRDDPLGGLQLENQDFASLTKAVRSRFPPGRVVSALEGGYNLNVLGGVACAHVLALGEL